MSSSTKPRIHSSSISKPSDPSKQTRPSDLRLRVSGLPPSPFSRILPTRSVSDELCLHFVRHGSCKHETQCRFVHDLGRVQLCRAALRSECSRVSCPLSHDRDVERAPECQRWLRGRCALASCPYAHVKKSANAPDCPAFLNAYCIRGRRCPLRHLPPAKLISESTEDDLTTSPTPLASDHQVRPGEEEEEERILAEAWEAGKHLTMFT